MNIPNQEHVLPVQELEKLGLYREGRLLLNDEDIEALLAGRRTSMISMEDLSMDGFAIRQLDAKLSLNWDGQGGVKLNLHPIYKEAKPFPFLTKEELDELKSGVIISVEKEFPQPGNKKQSLIIQYDDQTREFISYRPELVEVPYEVNGETLSEKQKKAFQKGELVTLNDGTTFQHSVTDHQGIRSDRKALIFSVLLDGGISYLLLRGLKHLRDNRKEQKEESTPGFQKTLMHMKSLVNQTGASDITTEKGAAGLRSQHSRGYGRASSR